ncbi:hypothetical protein Pint_14099 [Pistacia integerrima]|uniref:Uncharacterized protein n=1 Tax=Pistacia integerrima TaxID=434235 RepID=A0ACC0YA64_9ROSI|nr:hypothetical protein Pint_14099 [Pistacia integerrima]
MPSPTLYLKSPFESIFHKSPNYDKLRVFGCVCYPWLRPYLSYKLQPRSKSCIFIGYSNTHNAYKCLDPSTKKVYISHHVQFVENQFLFTFDFQSSNFDSIITK